MDVRAEFKLLQYRDLGNHSEKETLCAVSGHAGTPTAAIRSLISDLLRLRPDAAGCIRAALEDHVAYKTGPGGAA